MIKKLRKAVAVGAWALLLCCGGTVSAQQEVFDSAAFDTARLGLKGAQPVDGELAPEAPAHTRAQPSEARWQQITSNDAYSYRDKLEYVREQKPPRDDSWLIELLGAVSRFFESGFGKGLLWIAFFAIIGYILWRILRGQASSLFARRDRRRHTEPEAAEVLSTESLLEADWELQLQQALQAGEYREAIRFAYLRLLQLMEEQGLIAYRPDKTNRDYLRVLQGRRIADGFRMLTRQYEWAWFGNVLPDAAGMNRFMNGFQELKHSIGAA